MSLAETTPLLSNGDITNRRASHQAHWDAETDGFTTSHSTVDEAALAKNTVGERLPYNAYTTIDWMHELVKDSYHYRRLHTQPGLRYRLLSGLDDASGWFAAAIIGSLTACVAFLVDVAVATISDWKLGYCKTNAFLNREACCAGKTPLHALDDASLEIHQICGDFHLWSTDFSKSYSIYVAFALAFGIISGSVTLLTKSTLPEASPGIGDNGQDSKQSGPVAARKTMYMAAGSGIPEIKTILSGFVIPNFLDFGVLVVKAVGSIFAVSTGMCLGKEGPFVHISACVGYLVARRWAKYRNNERKMREMLSAACAAGLSVAFGAPIGGVLFSYEEISTYFPRKVLWRAFLCSLFAAMVLRALNPNGTGKLVLFETNYGTSYTAEHYLIFVLLGIAGGVFGGAFCKLNFIWSRWFRSFALIKAYPVFEIFLIVAATALLQYPNPLIRGPGDVDIKQLLVDCTSTDTAGEWVCKQEAHPDRSSSYIGWLIYGVLAKLVLTIITFGVKVPSGVIIPALNAGALFGRLIGQWIGSISPGIFAMVGAGAFLAGVSRMTVSLVVIMFELTGELEYVVPHMMAILVAKWIADATSSEGVYDLAQTVLGHPFLDAEHAQSLVQAHAALAEQLIPPEQTMAEITVHVPSSNKIPRKLLEQKLYQLERRGLMDAGLVLVQGNNALQGYIGEGELRFGLETLDGFQGDDILVRVLGQAQGSDLDLSPFVDRTPFTISAKAPMEYCVEIFSKLGLRHLMVLEEGTGKLVGVIIKKRLVAYLDALKETGAPPR